MKIKFIYIITSILLFLVTNPVIAQEDPGDDPDVPAAPLDDYLWVLVLVGVVFAIIKLKASTLPLTDRNSNVFQRHF